MNAKVKGIIIFLILAAVAYRVFVFRSGFEDKVGAETVILCAGGSIAASAYPEFIQEEFRKIKKDISVINKGRRGYTPGEYLRYMESSLLLENIDPDIVLLDPGDVRVGAEGKYKEEFASGMEELIIYIKSFVNSKGRSPVLILGNIPPVGADGKVLEIDYARMVEDEINPFLAELSRRHRLKFVDNYKPFLENLDYSLRVESQESAVKLIALNYFKAVKVILDAAAGLTGPGLSGLKGKLVFQSDRDGQFEIYKINADGSGLRRLTENSCDDESPRWSPDGQEIVFESNRDGNWEIYKMRCDGSSVVRLTDSDGEDRDPSWFPDGKRIFFSSLRDGNWDVYVMDADGQVKERITYSPHKDILPVCSPDGRRISFTSNRLFGWQIYVMNSDGSEMKRLTERRDCLGSKWSPDGEKLVYVSQRGERKTDIWVMGSEGGEKRNLTQEVTDFCFDATWSPDGEKIAFVRGPHKDSGNSEIWVMNSDGTSLVQLTDNPARDESPDWASGSD